MPEFERFMSVGSDRNPDPAVYSLPDMHIIQIKPVR
jgi:hypothetical protein